MFGDYFRNLTTNQKIMFGVAVFLVVCVIVYLLYKYVFNAAKNFIQHYIMPTREKFEQIRLSLKSKCNSWEFYGSTTPGSTPANTALSCTRIPDRCVRSGEINWGTNKGDGLKFVLSYKGTSRFSANTADPTNPNNNSNSEHFMERAPATNSAVIPALAGVTTDNRYATLSSTVSSFESTMDAVIENDSAARYRTSSIILQSNLPSPFNVQDSQKDRAPESFNEVLSIYCKNVGGTPLVTRLSTNSFTGVTANHGIFYHVEQTTPTFTNSVLRGKHTYYMPVRMINFLRPNNNRTPVPVGGTDFSYNNVSTPNFDQRNLLNPVQFAQNNYANALQNCIDYVSQFKTTNKDYLRSMSAELLRICNLYSSVTVNQVGPALNANTQVFDNADYDIINVNNIFYLRVSNVDYDCGVGRIEGNSFCTGTGAFASITQTWQYSQPLESSRNLVNQNIFRETCALTPYTVTGGPGSCTGSNCSLTGAKFNYQGITPIFNLATGAAGSNLFKSFSPGQNVILPVNLISIGTTDNTTGDPNAPTWYQQVNQYELDVFSQASNFARQQCNAPDIVTAGIRAMPGQSEYSFRNTDEVAWTTGSSKVYVRRAIKASYHVNNPLRWQLYYIDNLGQPIQYGSQTGQSISSSQPSQVQSSLFIIGAPRDDSVANDGGTPSFVPVFLGVPNTPISTTYNPSDAVRSQLITIERNIWVGLQKGKVYNAANKTFTQMSGQTYNFGDLLRAFFYLTTGQWSATVTDYSLLSAVLGTEIDNLLWGVVLSPTQQPSTEGLKLYNYSTFASLNLPSSSVFNSRSITHGGIVPGQNEGTTLFYIDNANVIRRIVNGSSMSGTPTTSAVSSMPANETPIIFKSFPNGLGGILVTRTSTNIFRTYPVSNTLTIGTFINEQVIPIVDLDVTNNNFIAVFSDENAQNTNIMYGSLLSGSWSVRVLNITNSSSFLNDLFLYSSVRFCNKSSTALSNPNVIISTRLFTLANRTSGFLYSGVVSTNGIELTKILPTNYNIRSIACSDDATASPRPNIITIAVYNGPVICLNNSSPFYIERSVSSAIGKWVSVDITGNGEFQTACSEFTSTATQDLTSSDGRVLYADNFANSRDDWRIIPNPTKYTTTPEVSNNFNPTSPSFDRFFNAYNYNSVDITRDGSNKFITLNFSSARTYSGSKITATNETISGSGILNIRLS